MTIIIREAILDDADGVNAVYNPYIRTSAATFEITEHSAQDRRQWLSERLADGRGRVFVAVGDGNEIFGFAGASPFDARGAYKTSVKTSVFVAPERHGQGIAGRLYEALFEALAGSDVHRAYALIVPPNTASIALHERFGFKHIATLSEAGRKFGRYYDVMWFEKRL